MNLLIFFVLYPISRFFDSLRTIIMQKSIHYWSIIQKIHPSARKRMRKKRFDWDLSRSCSTQQHRYNTRHSSLEEGRASMHCYGERIVTCSLRVPPYIYTSLASIVTLQPRWICRSVPPPFFLSSFFELISFRRFKIGHALFRVPCW